MTSAAALCLIRSTMIRPITEADLDAVASLHLASYHDDHFTSRLPRKLLRNYYGEIIKLNPFSYIALSEDGQQPLGFVVGGLHTQDGINAFVRNNMLALIPVVIKHPTFLVRRLVKRLKRHSQQRTSNVKLRLLSIAVSAQSQSRGTGQALLRQFEQGLCSQCISEYGLSVHSTNVKAIKFYLRENFRIEFDTGEAKYYFKSLPVETLAGKK